MSGKTFIDKKPKPQKEKVDVSIETQEFEKYTNLASFFRTKEYN